jgi:predicted polyphosphate/ATP-dependent NAD kinase
VTSAAGLIVNPAAGRDIRRLVTRASLVSNQEKAAVVARVLEGLASVGTKTVWALGDEFGIVAAGLNGRGPPLEVRMLQVEIDGSAGDSTRAARMLSELGVGAIVTLGGDGTNRAVACGCGDVPLVAVSTGTNNVVPTMVDGTIAGQAAGLVATGAVPVARAARRMKRVAVSTRGERDFALIDVAVCSDRFVGSRAVWQPGRVRAVVLSRAEPWAVGLSSIGGRIHPVAADEPSGLYLEIGSGRDLLATVAPGLVVEVGVRHWRVLDLDEEVELAAGEGTVALDGERELAVSGRARARVELQGPLLVDIKATLEAASLDEEMSGGG